MRRERGVWLIIAYKLVKGGLWLVFAMGILVSMRMGLSHRLLGLADQLRHHSRAWSLRLAELVVSAASRRGLWTITVALIADGLVSLLEAWALLQGRWWGPWLVVVATSSFVPFEIIAIARHPHVTRIVLLVLNVAIVVYLARHALQERRERARPELPSSG